MQAMRTTGALNVMQCERWVPSVTRQCKRWGSYLENTILLKVGHKYIGCHCRHFHNRMGLVKCIFDNNIVYKRSVTASCLLGMIQHAVIK